MRVLELEHEGLQFRVLVWGLESSATNKGVEGGSRTQLHDQ